MPTYDQLDNEAAWNAEYEPPALKALMVRLRAHWGVGPALVGCKGDNNHLYGRHRSRRWTQTSVHCTDRAYGSTDQRDKNGDENALRAMDLGGIPATVRQEFTKRLDTAVRAGRLPAVAEWFGTFDGKTVVGWYQGVPSSSDSSHLGHTHVGLWTNQTNNAAQLALLGDILIGVSTAPSPVVQLRRPWPSYMRPGHYFGLITGPNESHGGYYVNERPDVKAIQQRLIFLGYVPGINNLASSWADGLFEQPTKDAVARWQRAEYAATTSRYGEVWGEDDWPNLMTY